MFPNRSKPSPWDSSLRPADHTAGLVEVMLCIVDTSSCFCLLLFSPDPSDEIEVPARYQKAWRARLHNALSRFAFVFGKSWACFESWPSWKAWPPSERPCFWSVDLTYGMGRSFRCAGARLSGRARITVTASDAGPGFRDLREADTSDAELFQRFGVPQFASQRAITRRTNFEMSELFCETRMMCSFAVMIR